MIGLAGTIAQEHGFTVVLEKSTIVYALDSYDFTDELITRFNAL
jgi:Skp family chaperone for outer membrane proteins